MTNTSLRFAIVRDGAAHHIGSDLATAFRKVAGFAIAEIPVPNLAAGLEAVANGGADATIGGTPQFAFASEGKWPFERMPMAGLRAIAALPTFRIGMLVNSSTKPRSTRELSGLRVAKGFADDPLPHMLIEAFLANAGLTWADVSAVEVDCLARQRQLFNEGALDAIMASLDAPPDKARPVRALAVNDSAASLEQLEAMLPGARIADAQQPDGSNRPVRSFAYDYALVGLSTMPDTLAAACVAALARSATWLSRSRPYWRNFSIASIARPLILRRHDAAGGWSGG